MAVKNEMSKGSDALSPNINCVNFLQTTYIINKLYFTDVFLFSPSSIGSPQDFHLTTPLHSATLFYPLTV